MSRRLQPQWLRQAADYIDKPLIPSPYDDEFDTDTLDPKWTMTGVAGSSWDSVNPISVDAAFSSGGARFATQSMACGKKSWFRIQPSSGIPDGQVHISQAIAFPTDACILIKAHFTSRLGSQPANDAVIGLGMYEDLTNFSNGVNVTLNRGNANAIQVGASRHIASAATTIGGNSGDEDNRGQTFHTVSIVKRGTDYHIWALSSEHEWYWVGNITWNGTPAYAHIYAFNSSTTAPGNSIVGVDYFRYSRLRP